VEFRQISDACVPDSKLKLWHGAYLYYHNLYFIGSKTCVYFYLEFSTEDGTIGD